MLARTVMLAPAAKVFGAPNVTSFLNSFRMNLERHHKSDVLGTGAVIQKTLLRSLPVARSEKETQP